MYSMTPPLTSDELDAAVAIVRVQRPLHWSLARRLLAEIARLRAALSPEDPERPLPPDEPAAPAAPAPALGAQIDESPR